MDKKKYTQRLFLSIELPRFAREQIVQARKTWRKQIEGDVRWVPPLNLNLVLRFLGELPVSQSKSLGKKLDQLSSQTKAFQMSVAGVGFLPSQMEAKSVYLELEEPEPLRLLREQIDEYCRKVQIPRDKKPFEPRVTLGWCSEPQSMPQLRIKPGLKGFMVRTYSLMEARQGQKGPSYHQLRRFSLSGE